MKPGTFRLCSCALLTALVLASGCGPSRAQRSEEKARLLARAGHYDQAIAVLEEFVNDAKDSGDTRSARKLIVLYKGLRESELKAARRRAKDEMLAIARALLDGQERSALYPSSLEEFDPSGALPRIDPWGRRYNYRPTPDRKGYRLECLGKDGEPGGTGDDQDLLAVSGIFVKDLNWEDR